MSYQKKVKFLFAPKGRPNNSLVSLKNKTLRKFALFALFAF